jgi:hypothetical protein
LLKYATFNNLWRVWRNKVTLLKYEEIICVLKNDALKEVTYKIRWSVVWHSILR